MKIAFALLLGVHLGLFLVFFFSRPAVTPDGWAFLESQRPVFDDTGMTIHIVADGLNFALARRPLGGWETTFGHIFSLVNLPAYAAAYFVFHRLQSSAFGSSKLNSDLATLVFAVVDVAQCLGISALLSRQKAVPGERVSPGGAKRM